MPDIFGADIAGQVLSALGGLVFDQTLIKTTSVRDPDNSTKFIKTNTPYACKGFVDNYKEDNMSGQSVTLSHRKIVILGASLPVGIIPEPSDRIMAEGSSFTIVQEGVVRDPAAATYECESR